MTQRIKVVDLETGKVRSLKKFKENEQVKFNHANLSFAEIVKRGLLSKNELEKLVAGGILKELKYMNKRYISRAELSDYFKKK